MNIPSTNNTIDPDVGQLPDLHVAWPISEHRFRLLARHWHDVGLWLSLWNRDGERIASDQEAEPFFSTLIDGSNAFCDAMARCVRSTLEHSSGNDPVIAGGKGPCPADIGLIAVAIMKRRRCIGAILGVVALTREPGEDFSRLCDECGLDRRAMIGLLSGTVTQSKKKMAALGGLLTLSVNQAREIEVGQEEISILTDNLGHCYEELHLIYEISRQMDIPLNPAEMLQKVGREMLEVSRAAGVAFVLAPSDTSSHPSASGLSKPTDAQKTTLGMPPIINMRSDESTKPLDQRVVQVGRGAPDLSDITRLDDCLQNELDTGLGYLLVNKVNQRSGLQWASAWLRHMAAFPLRQENQTLGVFYAINCIDDGDFTSVDIQLLRAVADRVTAALQTQHLYDDLADLLMGLLYALVNSVDAKDPYTYGHSERVAYLSRSLAQGIEMSPVACERVYLAGLLHDVGKIGVPDDILSKPGKLTTEEFDLLKKHPEIGERILSHVRQIRDLLPGVLYHHERMDGRGYPHRLAGQNIPLLGRIICLADSFDAMTTNRTYRSALPVSLAISEIRRCAGNQFDPLLAERFLSLDPDRLYHEAHRHTGGDLTIGRSGMLCTTLEGFTLPQGCLVKE